MSIRKADEMIERIAKALRVGRGCDAGEMPCPFCLWGPDEKTPEWDETGCIWLARAALSAAREPTAGMLMSIVDTYVGALPGSTLDRVWKTMIDAALDKPSQ